MRTVGSLALAIVGAFFFETTVDMVADVLLGTQPPLAFLAAGICLVIAGVAFFLSLATRGAAWAIVLPCGIATVLATPNYGEPRGRIIAGSTLGLTFVMAGLGRSRAERRRLDDPIAPE
jgi:hypothetical protein